MIACPANPFGLLMPPKKVRFLPTLAMLGVIACGGASWLARPASGATAFVDASAAGANDGSSWANAYVHLQSALAAAAIPANGITEIWVADGTYLPDGGRIPTGGSLIAGSGSRTATFQLLSGVAVYGGFVSGEQVLSERDPTVNVAVLSGDLTANDSPLPGPGDPLALPPASWGENSYHVVNGSSTNSTAVLDGFTVTHGNANSLTAPDGAGAGLLAIAGGPTLVRCSFISNTAQVDYFNGGGGAVLILNSPNAITIRECLFSGNRSSSAGAVAGSGGAGVTVADCTFRDNRASRHGGGLYVDNTNCKVIKTLFFNNYCGEEGGGLRNGNGTATITNCSFLGNRSDGGTNSVGGAIRTVSGLITLTNCVVSGNSSAQQAGGVFGNVAILDSVISKNVAGTLGGGARIESDAANSIFWGNCENTVTCNTQDAQLRLSSFPQIHYCDIQGLTGSFGGTGNIDSDPLFIDADGPDNVFGTEDDNFRLSDTSPCIDAGDNARLPADTADLDGDGNTAEPISRDLDVRGRRLNDSMTADTGVGTPPIVDLGAYEFSYGSGDLSGDGEINGGDIAGLIDCLLSGSAAAPCGSLDFDRDGDIDSDDLCEFIKLVLGTPTCS